MDTQNDGMEKVTPLKHGNFLVSMLDFWGVSVYLSKFVMFHCHVSLLDGKPNHSKLPSRKLEFHIPC